jgi:hypothetical protein
MLCLLWLQLYLPHLETGTSEMEVATCKMEEVVSLVQVYVEALSVTADSKECYIYNYLFVWKVNYFRTAVNVHNTNSYYHYEER